MEVAVDVTEELAVVLTVVLSVELSDEVKVDVAVVNSQPRNSLVPRAWITLFNSIASLVAQLTASS